MPLLLLTDNVIHIPNADYEVQKITTMLAKSIYEVYTPDGIQLRFSYELSLPTISNLIESNLSESLNFEPELESPNQILLFSTFLKDEKITYSFHLFTRKESTKIDT
jgi:hypothetical protein